ncbi:MAG: glycosyltransferase family 1 protein [Bacteroidota bacterium]
MRIAINTRFLLKDKLEGIGWYTYQVAKRLVEQYPEHTFIFLFDRPYAETFIFGDNVMPVVLAPPARHPILFTIWFEWSVVRALKKYKADVFLSTDNFCALRTKVPTVLVTHDLAFLHFPEQVSRINLAYYRYFTHRFLQKANQIVSVSEATRQDIRENYPIVKAPIYISGNGCRDMFRPLEQQEKEAVKAKYTDGKDYFFYIGAVHPRKNVNRLIVAFSAFKKSTRSEVKLLIGGRLAWQTGVVKEVYEVSDYQEDIQFLGYVEDEELPRLLGAALGLTYVSLFEGFGVPLLEAMYAEVPVLTSNVSSMPEVVGEAAILIDPKRVEAIKSGMIRIYEDEKLRTGLIEKGSVQRQRYSWERAAEVVYEAIEAAALGT